MDLEQMWMLWSSRMYHFPLCLEVNRAYLIVEPVAQSLNHLSYRSFCVRGQFGEYQERTEFKQHNK